MNDGMDKLSVQFKQMVTKIGELREQINAVLEENSELKIENERGSLIIFDFRFSRE